MLIHAIRNMEILALLSQYEGHYKCNLKQINAFFKELTKSKSNSFNIEHYSDFIEAFKCCNSIGTCSILSQFAVNSYILYNDVAEIERDRKYYKKIIDHMIKHAGPIYPDINALQMYANQNNSYLYCYHDSSNVEIFKLIAEFQIKLCPDLLYNGLVKPGKGKSEASTGAEANKVECITSKSKSIRRIKVGFISDFIVSLHSVAKDRLGIIKHLCTDPEFDVKIMSRKAETDVFFNIIAFKNMNPTDLIVKMDNENIVENRQQIADQQFDIIVYPEIGMCSKNRWIAFSRLAPIQIATWGHSDTSGLPNIDYFVSSKCFNSPDDEDQYSEKLILFNSLGTYYHDICKVLKQQPDFANHDSTSFRKRIIEKTGVKNPNIYGCLQSFFKIHPSFVKMLDDILKMDPNGVIVMLSAKDGGDLDTEKHMKYINAGITHNDRLHFVYQSPFMQHVLDIKNCDLILDYFPFGGFNSTIESLSLGKICITRPGRRISGKFTQGLYKKMGITEFICQTHEEYVQKAVEYGMNCEKRKEYENCIAENIHKIFEETESVDEWKELLINLHNGNKLNY